MRRGREDHFSTIRRVLSAALILVATVATSPATGETVVTTQAEAFPWLGRINPTTLPLRFEETIDSASFLIKKNFTTGVARAVTVELSREDLAGVRTEEHSAYFVTTLTHLRGRAEDEGKHVRFRVTMDDGRTENLDIVIKVFGGPGLSLQDDPRPRHPAKDLKEAADRASGDNGLIVSGSTWTVWKPVEQNGAPTNGSSVISTRGTPAAYAPGAPGFRSGHGDVRL